MKQRKNAFTLIELLAVIVILAIIALIAVPVVMNIINKVNKSAFKDSAYGIIKAGELYYSNQLVNEEGMTEDKTFTFPNDILGLEIKGSKPTGGSMRINKEGKISLAITNGKYCIKKLYDEVDTTITETPDNCLLPILSQLATISTEVTKIDGCAKKGEVCNFGETVDAPSSFAIRVNEKDVYNFYVINDNGEEITLIMDRNLVMSAWISKEDYAKANTDDTSCWFGACTDEGPITALNSLKLATNSWINIPEREYIYVDDSGENRYSITEPYIMRARMLSITESINLGCTSDYTICPSYLYVNLDGDSTTDFSQGYWLLSADSIDPTFARRIGYGGFNYTGEPYAKRVNIIDCNGLRPVITLSK